MSGRFLRRIQKEVRESEKYTFENDGYMVHFDPENITQCCAIIVGPEDTPYEHCFFCIHFDLSNRYPLQPPVGKYLTNARNIRFNPNLYVNGKICLSLLGTWSGPGWTPANSVRSVLTAIQGLVLTDLPLRNEPSYEMETPERCAPYSRIVEHEALDTALVETILKPPPGFDVFRPFLEQYFVDHIDIYMRKLNHLKKLDGQSVSSTYGMNITYCFKKWEKKILSLYRTLTGRAWTPGEVFSKPMPPRKW